MLEELEELDEELVAVVEDEESDVVEDAAGVLVESDDPDAAGVVEELDERLSVL